MSDHRQCFTMISGTVLRSPCLPLARHLTTPSCDIGRLDLTFNPPPIWQPHPTPSSRGPISFYSRYAKKVASQPIPSCVAAKQHVGKSGTPPPGRPLRSILSGIKHIRCSLRRHKSFFIPRSQIRWTSF